VKLGVKWTLPEGYLIPRLPSRANFLLAIDDKFEHVYDQKIKTCFEM
jgi:23S rRNA A1618 N6-methylase RlmF